MRATLAVAVVVLSVIGLVGVAQGESPPGAMAIRGSPLAVPLLDADWTNMSPSGGPAGTIVNMAMVYDSAADRMVVFGGTDFRGNGSNKTWAYDYESNTWTDRNPATHPHAGWLDRAAYDSWAHLTIMFGGYDNVTKRDTNETWAYNYAGNTWRNLSAARSPTPRTRPGLAFDSQSDRVILFGGEANGFYEYSNETFSYNLFWNTWTNMSPAAHPEARRSSMMAYDSKADRMVLFGGTDDGSPGYGHGPYNDTWAYDYESNTWTNMRPATAPSPRYHGGFAYDSGVDRFVLYGGIGDENAPYETWLYDYNNNTWSLIAPDHPPPPKALMGMAFDTQSAQTIMFGGNAGGNTPGNETWAFTAENPPQDSGTDWTNMNPSDAPSGYLNMAMVYDSHADRMVVFGGFDGSDDGSNETWAYDFDSNTWTNLDPALHPNATQLARAAYDSGAQRTILFGGWHGSSNGLDGTLTNETWAYDFSANTWTNLGPAVYPSARSRQGMAFDAQSDRTILFGGLTIEGQYSDDTWSYDFADNTWANRTSDIRPPGRRSPGMAYDSKADRMILFGGWNPYADLNNAFNDTWAYDFDTNTWTNMSPPDGPAGQFGFGFSYDSGVDRCILFGGTEGGDPVTWAYDFTNNSWSLLRPDHSPPRHLLQGMAYDSQSARTIMFGGDSNDTWALATAPGLPSAPDHIWIRAGNGYLELHWRAPPDDGMSPITGYRIYRSTTPGQEALFAEVGNVDTWTDSDVTNGETYYYQLSALNAHGEGPRSAAVSAEPDGTPPVTSASLSGRLGNGGWWLSTVSVKLAASDDNSGVASTSFRVDGGGWHTYTAPIAVSGDGEHTVDFYSTDNAGNVEGWHSVGFRIDGTAPQTAISVDGTAGDGYWFHSIVTVDIAATDAGSGVDSIEYRLDGGTWATYAAPFEVGDGEHTVDAHAVDVAGSSGQVLSRSFGVDTTPPITAAQIAGPAGENGWYVGRVQVTLAATDALGTATIWYRVDGGSWTMYTSSLLFDTGVHTFDYYAVDASGLQEEVQTQTVSIDSVAPAASASLPSPAASGWYATPIPVTITASDALSGLASISYRIDGGAWQTYAGSLLLTLEGDHTVEYVAVDSAGNRGSIRAIEVHIDTTPPVVAAPSASLHVTTSQVTLTWTGTDAGSGIDHYEVRVDGGTFESVGSERSVSLQLADGSHTIVIRALDRAGNEASTAFTVRVDTNPLSTSGPYGATLPYAIVLAVIAVAVAGAVVVILRRRRTV